MIYKTILTPEEASKDFLENEKQFHLGVIPTEQSNPITKNLSATIQRNTIEHIFAFVEFFVAEFCKASETSFEIINTC